MIQSLFPAKKNLITDLKNLNALGFCLYISYLCYFDKLENCDIILSAYLIFDLFFSSNEYSLHHILTLSLTSYKSMYGISYEDYVTASRPFLKTEYSSIFLLIKYFYDEKMSESFKKNRFSKILYGINDLAFITTFVKFRVFDLYTNTIQNKEIHYIIDNYLYEDSYIQFTQFYAGMCGLYLLNFYWFCLISKKLYKQFVIHAFPQINTDKFAEGILSWTMFAAILPYVYNIALFKSQYLYDIVGITILSFASHYYHKHKSVMFNSDKDVYIMDSHLVDGMKKHDENASILYFADQASIHFKSFLSLIAMGGDMGTTSAIIHVTGFLGSQLYASLQPQIVQHASGMTEDNIIHMNVLNTCVIVPILYDLIHIICLSEDRIIQTQIALTIATIGIVLKLKPLYKLNHLVVHFLVILQTWYIASAIMNVSPSIE
jgi:hypothetical protein